MPCPKLLDKGHSLPCGLSTLENTAALINRDTMSHHLVLLKGHSRWGCLKSQITAPTSQYSCLAFVFCRPGLVTASCLAGVLQRLIIHQIMRQFKALFFIQSSTVYIITTWEDLKWLPIYHLMLAFTFKVDHPYHLILVPNTTRQVTTVLFKSKFPSPVASYSLGRNLTGKKGTPLNFPTHPFSQVSLVAFILHPLQRKSRQYFACSC